MGYSLGRCFSRAFSVFGTNGGTLILGILVMTGINILAALPFIALLTFAPYALFVLPVIMGGWNILLLNAIRDNHPSASDVFKGFEKYGQFLGAHWLLILYSLILGAVLFLIAAFLTLFGIHAMPDIFRSTDFFSLSNIGTMYRVLSPVFTGLYVIYALYLIRWSFVGFIIADGLNEGSIDKAFKLSAQITRGRSLWLYVTFLILSLFAMAGLLLCIVGVFVTGPIAGLVYTAIYEELRPGKIAPAMPSQFGSTQPPAPIT